jgi:NAD(P)-dependent dehydrogenase (short-subunit alcohol dehydrogenase family)
MKKVVFVTGVSRGIGLEVAERFAREGNIVYGCSRSAFVNPLFRAITADINSASDMAKVMQEIVVAHGSIDVIVNNAGYDLYGSFEGTHDIEFRQQLETNFFGTLNVVRAVLPYMKKQRSGKIINLSSIGGLLSIPYNSAYSASKFALEGFFESLRFELHSFKIHVVLIEPQGVKTTTLNQSIKTTSQESPDHQEHVNFIVKKMKSDGQKNGLSTDQVVNAVLRAASLKNPKLRYPVGGFVRIVPFLKLVLPQHILFDVIYKRFIGK